MRGRNTDDKLYWGTQGYNVMQWKEYIGVEVTSRVGGVSDEGEDGLGLRKIGVACV